MSIWHWNLRITSRRNHCGFWRKGSLCGLLLIGLLTLTTGCQVNQQAFERIAGDAGAAFSAASTTLNYFHHGQITNLYARASFEEYQQELGGLDQQLPLQQGVPDKHTIEQLLVVYKQAMQVIDHPCLDTLCNWHIQLASLDRASQTFLKAGGQ